MHSQPSCTWCRRFDRAPNSAVRWPHCRWLSTSGNATAGLYLAIERKGITSARYRKNRPGPAPSPDKTSVLFRLKTSPRKGSRRGLVVEVRGIVAGHPKRQVQEKSALEGSAAARRVDVPQVRELQVDGHAVLVARHATGFKKPLEVRAAAGQPVAGVGRVEAAAQRQHDLQVQRFGGSFFVVWSGGGAPSSLGGHGSGRTGGGGCFSRLRVGWMLLVKLSVEDVHRGFGFPRTVSYEIFTGITIAPETLAQCPFVKKKADVSDFRLKA